MESARRKSPCPMSHKILIVDDEPAIRRFLKASLESEGFQIVAAETAAQALSAVAQAKPDLMILDLGLPDLDGLDVIRQVRAGNPLPMSCCRCAATSRARSRRSMPAPTTTW